MAATDVSMMSDVAAEFAARAQEIAESRQALAPLAAKEVAAHPRPDGPAPHGSAWDAATGQWVAGQCAPITFPTRRGQRSLSGSEPGASQ